MNIVIIIEEHVGWRLNKKRGVLGKNQFISCLLRSSVYSSKPGTISPRKRAMPTGNPKTTSFLFLDFLKNDQWVLLSTNSRTCVRVSLSEIIQKGLQRHHFHVGACWVHANFRWGKRGRHMISHWISFTGGGSDWWRKIWDRWDLSAHSYLVKFRLNDLKFQLRAGSVKANTIHSVGLVRLRWGIKDTILMNSKLHWALQKMSLLWV